MTNARPRSVGIVGAGFTGTMLAVHLIELSRVPLRVIILGAIVDDIFVVRVLQFHIGILELNEDKRNTVDIEQHIRTAEARLASSWSHSTGVSDSVSGARPNTSSSGR